MSQVTPTRITKTFSLPKLQPDGSNWILFQDSVELECASHNLEGHLDGSKARPTVPRTAVALAEEETFERETARWTAGEATIRKGLAEALPPALYLTVRKELTVREVWTRVVQHHQDKAQLIVVELRTRLQNEKCPDKGSMRDHLSKLRQMREDLALMGETVTDENFRTIILASLPLSYDNFLTSITNQFSPTPLTVQVPERTINGVVVPAFDTVIVPPKISPDRLIELLGQEADRRSLRDGSAKKKESNEVALATSSDSTGTKKKDKSKVKCFNCKRTGHYQRDCFAKGGGKEGQWPKRKGEKTEKAATAKSDDEEDGWATILDGDSPSKGNRTAPADVRDDVEIYDSGASRHMSPYRSKFINFSEIPPKKIRTADRHTFLATGKGDMYIMVPKGKTETKVLLRDVLYSPEMSATLVSIGRIVAAKHTVLFRGATLQILNSADKVVGEIPKLNGLYCVNHGPCEGEEKAQVAGNVSVSIDLLHRKMGHISYEAARTLIRQKMITGVDLDEVDPLGPCESCEYAKTTRKPIQKTRTEPRAKSYGDEVHSDLWGPSPVRSIGGRRYYVTYTDGCTRWTIVDILRTKDEAFTSYRRFEAWVKTQRKAKIKRLFTDRGGEYMSEEFSDHLAEAGTVRRLTIHDTPEYNGVAERLNRTILERVRAILHASELPKFLWAEAVKHAVYLKNRTSTRALTSMTPFQAMFGAKPDLSNLPEWGVKVWVHDPTGSKLDGRSQVGRWVGFDEESHGHRIYWPDRHSVTAERSVKFDIDNVVLTHDIPLQTTEVHRPRAPTQSPPPKETGPTNGDEATTVENHPEPEGDVQVPNEEETTLKRTRKPSEYVKRLQRGEGTVEGKRKGGNLPRGMTQTTVHEDPEPMASLCEIDADEQGAVEYALVAATIEAEGLDPTFEEARRRPDWSRWEKAIQTELANLKQARTWTVIKRPPGRNVVGSRWVLRIKRNALGQVEKYKARLVAKGYSQVYGEDYFETFAPVARLASIRTILAIAAQNDWEIDTFDFHSAYLNGQLDDDEEVFMEQPPGFETEDRSQYVLKLGKAIYGLKQSGRKWYEALRGKLSAQGFRRCEADHAVFYRHRKSSSIAMAIHVDDCIIAGNDAREIQSAKEELNREFRLTDLGAIGWVLGIAVTRNRTACTLSLSQRNYIEGIVARGSFGDLPPRATPMDCSKSFSHSQCPTDIDEIARMSKLPYRRLLGKLMWADVATRPDIAFAVSTLAQFSNNPGKPHWEALKHVFQYLAGTKDWKLTYGGSPKGLEGYSDADGSSQEHRKAISGYAFLINGGAVSWASKKQEIIALSTAEAEYVAITHAAKEAIWLRRLINELFQPFKSPTTLYCDNQSAIALTRDGQFHARTKHIDIRYHFIRYVVADGTVNLIYCPTDEMVADTLTKALPNAKAKHFAHALGLRAA
jgi:transposase InsO family protein